MTVATPPARQSVEPASVIVCAYTLERWTDIVDGLRALAGQSLPPGEVIVVIDHNERLAERVRALPPDTCPNLRVVENDRARGLSGARNVGVAAAKFPIVAFLDDDAIPAPDWLAELCRPFGDPDVMGTGGKAIAAWPDARPRWFAPEFDWVVGCSYVGMPSAEAAVRNVIGCSMAFRAEVFERLGGFTEGIGRIGTLPLGCEETELCIRLGQLDSAAKIIYAPASVVHHRVSNDRTRFAYYRRRCTAEGRSKAAIGAMIGHVDGTSTERRYATRVLPRAVLRSTRTALAGDISQLGRAGAIVCGLLWTTAGYVHARVTMVGRSSRARFGRRRPHIGGSA